MPDDLLKDAAKTTLLGADPLTGFMFFCILILIGAIGVLYLRNQKQNDMIIQLVKDGHEVTQKAVTTLAVLSERIENALRAKG